MNDDDLRRALHDAAAGVNPRGSFEEIRAHRPKESPVSRRWIGPTLTAAAAVVLVIGGVAWATGQQDDSPAADRDRVASPGVHATPDEQATTAPDPGRTASVPVYYVGRTPAGPRLFAETHSLDGITGTDLQAAVQEAIGSPPKDPDYSGWPPADGLAATAQSDGSTLTIDLSEPLRRPSGMDDAAAGIALQALVWTADAAASSDLPVRFLVAGQPADELLGLSTTSPLAKASADSTLSTVSIESPTQGQTVDSGFTVSGKAATFEANVVWELKQGDRVVRHGFTSASECCTLSPYSFTVTATPGDYTLVVHDTDESDGEGVGTSEDTKEITVR